MLFRSVYLFGDTPHDMFAAVTSGVEGIGVTTGVFSAEELYAAGATTVIDGVSDLAAVLAVLS